MNIAILHYSVSPIVGGVESVIAHHARLMSANGHSVRLIAGRGEASSGQIPLIHVPLADSRHERIAYVKQELDRGLVTADFEVVRDKLVIEMQTALTGAAVLIAHNVCSLNKNLPLTAALHQLHGSGKLPRLILWHHDLAWTTPRYRSELHEGYPWDLLRKDWRKTTHVVVSESRRAELAGLMNLDPASIEVIPNGMDIERFLKLELQTKTLITKMSLWGAAPILLLPVRLTPRKNIELALHTVAELKEYLPQAALVVTGPLGPHDANNHKYLQKLLDLRRQLNLQGAAYFLAELVDSFLSEEVIADFYRVADALFLPSREEGFGIPILEAGLSAMPIFCSGIPPLRSLGSDHATYFSPDADPHELAKLIATQLLSSPLYRLRADIRERYTWEHIYSEKISPILEQ
ncbi:MAG TPA: glycosyltransferase family 4 protein [Anaerolineales bacterium]|nr:glycosyltransferase family 4 protein [Anaerolineales bacterium]